MEHTAVILCRSKSVLFIREGVVSMDLRAFNIEHTIELFVNMIFHRLSQGRSPHLFFSFAICLALSLIHTHTHTQAYLPKKMQIRPKENDICVFVETFICNSLNSYIVLVLVVVVVFVCFFLFILPLRTL